MSQFDSLIIFPLLWSSLLFLIFNYVISLNITIPRFFKVKKFRKKKLNSPIFYNNFLNSNLSIKKYNSYNYTF